jgi:chromosome segregation ATPase
MRAEVPSKLYSSAPLDSANVYREPQVAYSAELTVATREFAHSRASLEEILERHHGYVAKLRMVGEPTGSILSATLRLPSSEYRSALAELKGVGAVEHEEEAADEITQHHSELEARLVNAQNEEQRIQRILQNKDDKFSDFGSLERQVATVRGEIERIEAERAASSSRVSFANVFISLREERASTTETIGAKLRTASIGGLNDALDSFSSILMFMAAHGPLIVLWAVLIYFPGRYFWRRRSQLALSATQAPKNS